MTGTINLNEQLKHHFGFDSFKGDQEAIIRNLLEGNDTFVLMPTGGGKSLCYQLPSLIMEGTAIVVSPLIALMKNQVDVVNGLSEETGVAHYLNSSLNRAAINQVYKDVHEGRTKLLYVAPESLNKEDNLEFFRSFKISFYAIDEAHCISEWGHDFRPEYRNIRPTINKIGAAPVIALTATATDKVRMDIKKSLGIADAKEFKSSFNRANLYYEVRQKTNDIDKQIIKFIKQHPGKSGIIYCISRKKVEELAAVLKANDIKAAAYHAGLDSATRSQTQDDFLMERIDVIVATIAFGMGIDKPDVRLVVHIDCPDSPEAYFQEAGRAGRDGQKAYAVLLFAPRDKGLLQRRVEDTFPEKDYIRKVYEDLQYYYQMAMGDGRGCTFAFNIEEFCLNFKHFPVRVDSALKLLTRAGYLEYTDEQDNASRLMFTLRRDELYRIHENSEATEQLIRCLLRSYTGLFSDYAFIDEGFLSRQSGLSRQEVYESLVLLSHRRILHYIPGKKTPYIIYTRERQETARIVLSREVYEERKESYLQRIQAMVSYAESQDHCRSQFLLRYFGEKDSRPCCQCDVCLQQHSSGLRNSEFTAIADDLLRLLEETPLTPAELAERMTLPLSTYEPVLSYLLNEERIRLQEGKLTKASHG